VLAVEKTMEASVKGLEIGYEYYYGVPPDGYYDNYKYGVPPHEYYSGVPPDEVVEIYCASGWETPWSSVTCQNIFAKVPGFVFECFYRRRSAAYTGCVVTGLDGRDYVYGIGVPPAEAELFYGFEWSSKEFTRDTLKSNTIDGTPYLSGIYRIARPGRAGLN